jgi:predicted component of type VI protein secretion system
VHDVNHAHDLAPPITLFDLAIDQAKGWLPLQRTLPDAFNPVRKMCGERAEVQVETSLVNTGREPGANVS